MACNICGSRQHEATTAGCPNQRPDIYTPMPIGWLCPACGKGNAPDAKACGHCADKSASYAEAVFVDVIVDRKRARGMTPGG